MYFKNKEQRTKETKQGNDGHQRGVWSQWQVQVGQEYRSSAKALLCLRGEETP